MSPTDVLQGGVASTRAIQPHKRLSGQYKDGLQIIMIGQTRLCLPDRSVAHLEAIRNRWGHGDLVTAGESPLRHPHGFVLQKLTPGPRVLNRGFHQVHQSRVES